MLWQAFDFDVCELLGSGEHDVGVRDLYRLQQPQHPDGQEHDDTAGREGGRLCAQVQSP